MSHDEDSFNDAELAILAIEIAKDFKELSIKGNVDPDDSFVSKFELEPDIIHPSRSISYSDDPKIPPIDYSPAIHHDEYDYDRLTIVSLSANDSLKSLPPLPDKKAVPFNPINIHQTKYHSYTRNTRTPNDLYSPQSTISIKSPSCDSVRHLPPNAYSTTRKSHSSVQHHYPPTLSPCNSPIDASHCLAPHKSVPRMTHHRRKSSKRKSIQKKDRKRSRSKSRNRGPHKYRSDELNRVNTKRFYTMRSTKSLMVDHKHHKHDNKKRSKSQNGRLKHKRERKYKSDALHGIRSRCMNHEAPKEPAPYFVKRARGHLHQNTLIDLSLEEVDPFFELSSNGSKHSSLYKANNIRFLYCNDDDTDDETLKRKKKNDTALLQQSNSMFTMRKNRNHVKRRRSRNKLRSRPKVKKMKAQSVGLCANDYDNEYMVECEDGFMFINHNADIV